MLKKKWKNLSSLRKKAFAVTLATAVVSTTLNIGSVVVTADTSVRGRVISAFEELPEDIAYQNLPVGSERKDIVFPDTLKVTLYSEDEEASKETEESTEATEEREPEESTESIESSTEAAAPENTENPSGDNETPASGDNGEEGNDAGSSGDNDEGDDAGSNEGDSGAEDNESGSGDGDSEDRGSGSGSDSGSESSSGSEERSGGSGNDNSAPAESSTPAETSAPDGADPEDEDEEGASISDIFNPFAPLTVYAAELEDDEDAPEDNSDAEPELRELSDGDTRVLEGVEWKLNRDKSQYGSRFQAEVEGDVFVFEPDIRAFGLRSDVPLPEIVVTIVAADEEATDATEATEEDAEESPEFSQFTIIGGVKISVDAPEGVFPEGAVLKVRKVIGSDKEKVEEVIASEEGMSDGEAAGLETMAFDVTILDKDGNEIQPDTSKGEVKVTFSDVELGDNEDLKVYHFNEDLSSAESLDADVDGDDVTVSPEHFSVFVVSSTASTNGYATLTIPDHTCELDTATKVEYWEKYVNKKINLERPWSNNGKTIPAGKIDFDQNTLDIPSRSLFKYKPVNSGDTAESIKETDTGTGWTSLNPWNAFKQNAPVLQPGTWALKIELMADVGSAAGSVMVDTVYSVFTVGKMKIKDEAKNVYTFVPGRQYNGTSITNVISAFNVTNFTNQNPYHAGTWAMTDLEYRLDTETEYHEYNAFDIKDAGEHKIIARVKNDPIYEGELEYPNAIKITPKKLLDSMVSFTPGVYYYDGKEHHPESEIVVKDAGITGTPTLQLGKDYTLEYENAVEAGNNAKVKIVGKGNYEGTVTKTFSIIQYNGTVLPLYNGSSDIKSWYPSEVDVTAEGYTVSDSPNGSYASKYTWKGTGKDQKKTLYFKTSDGKVIKKEVGPLNFDSQAPKATIKLKGKSSSTIQSKKKIMAYTNEAQKFTITGTDEANGSGLGKMYYYISKDCHTSESALKDAAKDKWTEYEAESKVGITENKLNFVYAKVEDVAGNATYVSTQGVWYDTKKPTIDESKAKPEDTKASVEVKGSDSESGIAYYYLVTKKKDEKAPAKPADVKSGGLKTENGKFDVTGLTAQTAYKTYAVIEDKCGNLSEIKEGKINTKEAKTDEAKAAEDAAKGGAAGGAGGAGGAGAGGAAGGGAGGAGGSSVEDRVKDGKDAKADKSGDGSEKDDSEIKDKVPYISDATEGILIGRDKTSGWDKIEEEVKKAEAPAQVDIEMNGGTVVPLEMLSGIKDRDMTMRFNIDEGVAWVVNGMSFTDQPSKDINFGVKTNTKNIPSKVINGVADVYPHINLTLDHDGDFGFTAMLVLDVGDDKAGMFGNLYYYNEDTKELEFVESAEINSSGKGSFDFTHASDYTVIVRGDALTEKTAAALTTDNLSEGMDDGDDAVAPVTVKRGGNRLWLIIISIVSFILCGMILLAPDNKKKRAPGY